MLSIARTQNHPQVQHPPQPLSHIPIHGTLTACLPPVAQTPSAGFDTTSQLRQRWRSELQVCGTEHDTDPGQEGAEWDAEGVQAGEGGA